MELTRSEIRHRLGRLRRLIEWVLKNVRATTTEKLEETEHLKLVERIESRVQDNTYRSEHLQIANRLWRDFKAFITGSMPDEVDRGE